MAVKTTNLHQVITDIHRIAGAAGIEWTGLDRVNLVCKKEVDFRLLNKCFHLQKKS